MYLSEKSHYYRLKCLEFNGKTFSKLSTGWLILFSLIFINSFMNHKTYLEI